MTEQTEDGQEISTPKYVAQVCLIDDVIDNGIWYFSDDPEPPKSGEAVAGVMISAKVPEELEAFLSVLRDAKVTFP